MSLAQIFPWFGRTAFFGSVFPDVILSDYEYRKAEERKRREKIAKDGKA
jgi:hypothetical protein